MPTYSGSTPPAVADANAQLYYYSIQLSQLNDIINEGSLQSGLELGSNSMQISFTTPNCDGVACKAYICYRYPYGIKTGSGCTQQEFLF